MYALRLRATVLACVLVTFACTGKDGPTPSLSSLSRDHVCVAQQAITITLTGSGFSPVVKNALTDNPTVEMPRVFLIDPSGTSTEVPADGVSVPDASGTMLVVSIPMNLVPPGAYGVEVENPDDHSTTLAGSLTIDAPPTITSVAPNSGAAGTMVTVTITGTGFQPGMTVTLDAMPPVVATNVTVSPDGTTAMATFDLTGVKGGVYSITVDNNDRCAATLMNAFTVRSGDFTLSGIDPPFGCMCSPTNVTISSSGGFVSTPRVEMRPHGQTMPVYDMDRVAFVDTSTITAVVPMGLPLGTYDVTVINPPSDGRQGTLANAFRVVPDPIPTIEQVVPSRGAPGATSFTIDIYGENFRSPIKVELLDRTLTAQATAMGSATTVVSATHATATFTALPMTEDAYLVRLTDLDENTYSTWSAFVVGASGASGNLHMFSATSALNTGRRMLGGVSARDDLGNSFVYAIGGDTGGMTPSVLATIEVAQLSKFGALASWQQEKATNNLATQRDAPTASAVVLPNASDPFGPPIKTYIYVAGGRDAGGTVLGTVERAMVLRNADAPIVGKPTPGITGTLAAGTWYYKVAAICGMTDLDNPNGETLPSDEQIITLDSSHDAATLSWSAVATPECSAVGYKVYRTAAVDGTSQKELLIKKLGAVLTYTDNGDTAGTEVPLPPGALGVWSTETITLAARWGHQAAAVPDGAAGLGALYVLGGKSNATTGYLASIEYAPIDATGHLTGVTFVALGATALPTATAFFSLAVETAQNVAGHTATTPRFVITGGATASGASNQIEVSDVTSGGGNGAWAPGFTNMGNPGTLLNTVAGVMTVIASDKLWAVGGARMFNNTTQAFSNVTSGADDVTFDSGGSLVAPTNSAANTLPAPLCLGVPITGSGFIYFVGGSSDGTNAVTSAYQTF